MKVRIAPQVADFVRRLAPEPRRKLRYEIFADAMIDRLMRER